MARKPVDYDGMISVYDRINRQRELTPEESNDLADIIRRKTNSEARARYKAKNPAKVAAAQSAYRRTDAYRAAMIRASTSDGRAMSHRRYRVAHREELAARARARYRLNRSDGADSPNDLPVLVSPQTSTAPSLAADA